MTIYSWNVNGIRAAEKKGLFTWLVETSPDILCLQETKAQKEQLGEVFFEQPAYETYWASAERKGYSGTSVYTKHPPEQAELLGVREFDVEGRVQLLFFSDFVLINAYFPNSQPEGARLQYKLEFCAALKERADDLVRKRHNVIICGDYNIAHKAIDLARPKQNEGNPGYLPEERAWMDSFIGGGYTDTFRIFNQEPEQYTWWSYRMKAREKNIGWRLDYFCVNDEFAEKVRTAEIHSGVTGSDHCPVSLNIAVPSQQ